MAVVSSSVACYDSVVCAGAGEPRVRQPRATALAAAQKLADFVAHQEETLRVRPHALRIPTDAPWRAPAM